MREKKTKKSKKFPNAGIAYSASSGAGSKCVLSHYFIMYIIQWQQRSYNIPTNWTLNNNEYKFEKRASEKAWAKRQRIDFSVKIHRFSTINYDKEPSRSFTRWHGDRSSREWININTIEHASGAETMPPTTERDEINIEYELRINSNQLFSVI